MGDYYHQFLSSMSSAGQNRVSSPHDTHPPPIHHNPAVGVGGSVGLPGPYQSLGYFTGFPEPIMFNSAPKPHRSRRKSAPGLDHVKHRRTRSGCYTCRSRRVKCDETHPVCDRCRKGKRDCVYPPDSLATARTGAASALKEETDPSQQTTSPTSSHEEEDDDDDDDDGDHNSRLDPIPDADEPEQESTSTQAFRAPSVPRRPSTASILSAQRIATTGGRQGSETPSLEGTRTSSPSTSPGAAGSAAAAVYPVQELVAFQRPEWAHLPHDVRFYLAYFTERVTHYHYGILTDSDDFFRTILPGIAVRNDALLYALVGFAAYHFTLRNPRGRIQDFLQYYNKSVTLLLSFLKRKERHNPATLLTILQLATIEEYLGDWINLTGHQRAAHEVLTQLYTPEAVIETQTGRATLTWYMRFDVFVGLMGGVSTALPEAWFLSLIDHFQSQSRKDPANPSWKIDECLARLRLVSREISVLLDKHSSSEMSDEDFASEHTRLSQRLGALKEDWDPALRDPTFQVRGLSAAAEADSVVDVSVSGVLYEGPLFPVTLLSCVWHTVLLMHESQGLAAERSPEAGEGGNGDISGLLANQAYTICQIVEAIELWPSNPRGSLIITQACLAIAALFLPHDTRHQRWIRRKFALLESTGYIFPLSMRTRMAELFDDDSCIRWWLPNDEGFSPILRAIRAFADERNATAARAQRENIPEVRHIFEKLQIGGAKKGSFVGRSAGGTEEGKGKAPMQ